MMWAPGRSSKSVILAILRLVIPLLSSGHSSLPMAFASFGAPPPVGFVPPACTWQSWLFHTGVVAVRCRSFSDCCHFVAHLDVIQACRRLRSHCSVVLQHDFNSPAKTGVGTPVYMAPEIILGGKHYDAKVKHDSLAAA